MIRAYQIISRIWPLVASMLAHLYQIGAGIYSKMGDACVTMGKCPISLRWERVIKSYLGYYVMYSLPPLWSRIRMAIDGDLHPSPLLPGLRRGGVG